MRLPNDQNLSPYELRAMGIKFGENCRVSRLARIYATRLELGDHVRIDDYTILTGDIKIGSRVHIPPFCALYGKFGIVMGDYTGLCPHCLIFTEADDYSGRSLLGPTVPDWCKPGAKRGIVVIENHAVIGAGSIVLPGVLLGEGAIVGAQSLVKDDCDAWTIYAGTPVKPIKKRDRGLLALATRLEAGA